ncbi:MAG: DEAD/DEAH box helicase [Acidobacteriota bacterium]
MSKSNPRGELETEFSAFDLCPAIQKGLASAGFLTPRPIQAATISQALRGRDILGLAQTGTGKTAAFALPILERLLADRSPNGPRALIVAPTRELASQIAKEIAMLARYSSVRTTTVFGGVPAQPQIRALRKGADILVACPGRLLDLFRQGEVHLDRIEVLVLDEADHMFDMGFLPDVRRIIGAVPRSRQTMLFSATMPTEIRGLADSVLRNPHAVDLGHSKPIDLVKHALCTVDQRDKFDALERVFNDDEFTSAIVFTRTKYRAKRLAQQLDRCGHSAVALQGNMSQPQRVRAMDTHRIGRTGRSERTGTAISFVTPEDREILRAVEKVMGNAIPHWAPHSPGTLGSAPGPRRAEARQPKVLDSSPALRARKSRKGQAASFPRGRHAAYSRKRSGANSKAEKGQAPSLGSFSH